MDFFHMKDGMIYNDYGTEVGKAIEFKLTWQIEEEFHERADSARDLWNPKQTWKKRKRLREKDAWISRAPYGVTFIAAGYVSLDRVVGYYDPSGEIVWY